MTTHRNSASSWRPRRPSAATSTRALPWLDRAFEAGYRDSGFLERDPIFRPLGGHADLVRVPERMRGDVAAQRERARTRGLLELQSLIGLQPRS